MLSTLRECVPAAERIRVILAVGAERPSVAPRAAVQLLGTLSRREPLRTEGFPGAPTSWHFVEKWKLSWHFVDGDGHQYGRRPHHRKWQADQGFRRDWRVARDGGEGTGGLGRRLVTHDFGASRYNFLALGAKKLCQRQIQELEEGGWWRRGGSNSRPSHCERDALPAELRPHSVQCDCKRRSIGPGESRGNLPNGRRSNAGQGQRHDFRRTLRSRAGARQNGRNMDRTDDGCRDHRAPARGAR